MCAAAKSPKTAAKNFYLTHHTRIATHKLVANEFASKEKEKRSTYYGRLIAEMNCFQLQTTE